MRATPRHRSPSWIHRISPVVNWEQPCLPSRSHQGIPRQLGTAFRTCGSTCRAKLKAPAHFSRVACQADLGPDPTIRRQMAPVQPDKAHPGCHKPRPASKSPRRKKLHDDRESDDNKGHREYEHHQRCYQLNGGFHGLLFRPLKAFCSALLGLGAQRFAE